MLEHLQIYSYVHAVNERMTSEHQHRVADLLRALQTGGLQPQGSRRLLGSFPALPCSFPQLPVRAPQPPAVLRNFPVRHVKPARFCKPFSLFQLLPGSLSTPQRHVTYSLLVEPISKKSSIIIFGRYTLNGPYKEKHIKAMEKKWLI